MPQFTLAALPPERPALPTGLRLTVAQKCNYHDIADSMALCIEWSNRSHAVENARIIQENCVAFVSQRKGA
jgi:hypothetical protein